MVICLMAARRSAEPPCGGKAAVGVAVGAGLFMLRDALLAISMFAVPCG